MSEGWRSERGDTLVEILVSIVIIGIAFTALLAGLQSSIMGSRIHRNQATVETVLRSYGEAVKAQVGRTGGYVPCATTYSIAGYTPPSAGNITFTPSITGVQWWNGSAFASAACPPLTEGGLQLISLKARASDGTFETTSVVVRKA